MLKSTAPAHKTGLTPARYQANISMIYDYITIIIIFIITFIIIVVVIIFYYYYYYIITIIIKFFNKFNSYNLLYSNLYIFINNGQSKV